MKIVLTLEEDKDEVAIASFSEEGLVRKFNADVSQLAEVFGTNFDIGYMPVNGDGIVHVSERNGNRVVIAQRAQREKTKLDLHGKHHTVTTPWTYLFWKLKPHEGHYRMVKERLYLGTGEWLGDDTMMYDGWSFGNIHSIPYDSTSPSNICWGTTTVIPNGIVGLYSVFNIVNDFWNFPFTDHLFRTPSETWKTFTTGKDLPKIANKIETIQKIVKALYEIK